MYIYIYIIIYIYIYMCVCVYIYIYILSLAVKCAALSFGPCISDAQLDGSTFFLTAPSSSNLLGVQCICQP